MDFQKANIIFESENIYEVLYNGQSVWIDSLNPANKTAEITLYDNSKKNISVNELELVNN